MDDPAQPMVAWVRNAPAADLAAELMAAFGPDGVLSVGAYGRGVLESSLVIWLLRAYPKPRGDYIGELRAPISEALQLLEHAELVYHSHYRHSDEHGWSPTRLGLATLANGKAAVRQRIVDRTGL